jgi:hypothetical protein
MDIGTGIFLSSLVLASLALFAFTKDRWPWRRIFLWPLLIVLGLSILGFSVYYIFRAYESRPKPVTEFKGFKLGEKFSDAVFRHGLPKRSETLKVEDLAKYIVDNAHRKGTPDFEKASTDYKKAKDAEALANAKGVDGTYYFNDISVSIKNDQVEDIAYLCTPDSTDLTSVNGVACGHEGDEIIKRFDKEIQILCWRDGLEADIRLKRMYKAPKFGMLFVLNKNKVIGMMVGGSKVIESFVGERWGQCS